MPSRTPQIFRAVPPLSSSLRGSRLRSRPRHDASLACAKPNPSGGPHEGVPVGGAREPRPTPTAWGRLDTSPARRAGRGCSSPCAPGQLHGGDEVSGKWVNGERPRLPFDTSLIEQDLRRVAV